MEPSQVKASKPENKVILNLGCGDKISEKCINIDWSLYTRMSNSSVLRTLASPFIGENRRRKLESFSGTIKSYNLKKGIPFNDCSVDAVYHSHLFEHLDRDIAPLFLKEILRVLKPGSTIRIVVPDLHFLINEYLRTYSSSDYASHENSISEIFEQCVRRESYGSKNQPLVRRKLENILLGDARKRGETHQWMYDRVNLSGLLKEVGYQKIETQCFDKSKIDDNWLSFGLDIDSSGREYKPGSLYIEAVKPNT